MRAASCSDASTGTGFTIAGSVKKRIRLPRCGVGDLQDQKEVGVRFVATHPERRRPTQGQPPCADHPCARIWSGA